MKYIKIFMRTVLFSLIFTVLSAWHTPETAYGAYCHSGTASENTFSLVAAETFSATLSPDITAGNGSSMKLTWYVQTETEWKKIGAARRLPDDGAEALQKAQLQVEVSFQNNHRIYRYELSNEAGTVLSEAFQLSVSKNGSSVICRKESYETDLSEYRP